MERVYDCRLGARSRPRDIRHDLSDLQRRQDERNALRLGAVWLAAGRLAALVAGRLLGHLDLLTSSPDALKTEKKGYKGQQMTTPERLKWLGLSAAHGLALLAAYGSALLAGVGAVVAPFRPGGLGARVFNGFSGAVICAVFITQLRRHAPLSVRHGRRSGRDA